MTGSLEEKITEEEVKHRIAEVIFKRQLFLPVMDTYTIIHKRPKWYQLNQEEKTIYHCKLCKQDVEINERFVHYVKAHYKHL